MSQGPANGTASAPLVEPKEEIFIMDDIIRRRAQEFNQKPIICFPKREATDYEEHSAQAVDNYVDAAVVKLRQLGIEPANSALEKSPVVGILAQSGLHVLITIFALSRLGYTPFVLSIRLAAPAIGHLLGAMDCQSVLATTDYEPVLNEVKKSRKLDILPLLAHSDFYGVEAPRFTRSYDPHQERFKTAFIMHSSGSTGLPKPILLSHAVCIATLIPNMDLKAFIASPLYHTNGLYQTYRTIYTREPLYYCNYALPMTGPNLLKMINFVKPGIFHAVPYVIKLLAEIPDGVRALAGIKIILFTGSSCPDELGDRLAAEGVHLVGSYGSTETGPMMNSVRPPEDKAWNYLRLLPYAKSYTLMDEIAPGLYECVALAGLKSLHQSNSANPPGSFRTRDLFEAHPTREGLWKFVSRLDDRFNLLNGEKVLPIPIEGRIRQSKLVKEAVVVGEGRSLPGLLVIKADSAANMPDLEFLEAVWAEIEAANAKAETYSRISKDLIVVMPHDTQYPQTDKGTFIRRAMYRKFEKEIKNIFEEFENDNGGELKHEGKELENFILTSFKEHINVDLSSEKADFFAAGVDSLQCLQMWSLLKRKLFLGGRQGQLRQNILYETGNVAELSAHLERLRSGDGSSGIDDIQVMEDLVKKYSTFKPFVSGPMETPTKNSVLLTGSTGGLGTRLLAQLAASEGVGTIWALVRGSSPEAAWRRIRKSIQVRNLSLTTEQESKIIALPCDLGQPSLGLDQSVIDDIQLELSHVIHCAWAVNFNISLQSFEDQHIKAVHNLIQLCASVKTREPAQFYFCSSVSAAARTPQPRQVQECHIPSASFAQGIGYARSKWVAEQITRNAMKYSGIPARNLRIGQLVGDSKSGKWNISEFIPMMIQTAVTLGVLPTLDEQMSWLPVDRAATAIMELTQLNASSHADMVELADPDLVYHVVDAREFHWTRDMLPLLAGAGLEFQAVPVEDWMFKLREAGKDPIQTPLVKLMGWMENEFGLKDGTKDGKVLYVTEKSEKYSQTLAGELHLTSAEFIRKVVDSLKADWGVTSQ